MKIKKILQSYPWQDLIAHAVYVARCGLDRVYSSAIFRLKCSLLGIQAGKGARIWGRVYFHRFPGSEIRIGRNVRIVSNPYRYAFNIFPQSKIRTFKSSAKVIIGDDVGFNSISIVARSQTIEIGDSTMIGGNCQIMDTDAHPVWPPESRWTYVGDEYDAPVQIGSNVFIGLNVLILKGAKIGDNSVIAAGSVVTHEIPRNCLAGGVPARVLKRFGIEG